MRTIAAMGIVTALTTFGCASVGSAVTGTAERDFSGATRRATPSLRAGAARVVDVRVHPSLPLRSAHASRVELDDGHFIVCWTRGSVEEGHRALAQAFKADGSPLGAPVVISPPDVDVVETPRAVATDGQHIVATFAAASQSSMDLFAVPIETQAVGGSDVRTAQR